MPPRPETYKYITVMTEPGMHGKMTRLYAHTSWPSRVSWISFNSGTLIGLQDIMNSQITSSSNVKPPSTKTFAPSQKTTGHANYTLRARIVLHTASEKGKVMATLAINPEETGKWRIVFEKGGDALQHEGHFGVGASGELILLDADAEVVMVYAAGQWRMIMRAGDVN